MSVITLNLRLEEPFEKRRRRELLADLKLWDGTLEFLVADLRDERMKAGLAFHQDLPTPMQSIRTRALLAGVNEVSRWRNETLAEYAALV